MRDPQLGHCRSLGRIDAGEADQFLRAALAVISDVTIWNFGAQISALEAQHDRFVDRIGLAPVVLEIAGRNRPKHRAWCDRKSPAARARGAWNRAELSLAELVGRLPDVCMTIDDQMCHLAPPKPTSSPARA